MKMIYCTCNVSVVDTIVETLESLDILDYQVFNHVNVKNVKGDPRLNTPVWPGYNAAIFMQISDDEKVKNVIEVLKEYNQNRFDDELITVCCWSIDTYFYD